MVNSHSDEVNFVAFSSNGCDLMSGLDNNTVWIWNTEERIRVLEDHSYFVLSVAFSSNDTQVHTVRIRNVATASVKLVLTK